MKQIEYIKGYYGRRLLIPVHTEEEMITVVRILAKHLIISCKSIYCLKRELASYSNGAVILIGDGVAGSFLMYDAQSEVCKNNANCGIPYSQFIREYGTVTEDLLEELFKTLDHLETKL